MADLTLNRLDTAGLGFFLEDIQGWSDLAAYKDSTVIVPGVAGDVPAGGRVVVPSRVITFVGVLKGAGSAASLLLNQQALEMAASSGIVEITLGDNSTRAVYARLEAFEVGKNKESPLFVVWERQVIMRFRCFDPYIYDIVPTLIPLQTGLYSSCPIGTAQVRAIIRVSNPGAALTITLASSVGITQATLVFAFSPSLGAADWVEIDCSTGLVTKSVSGVVTQAYSSITSGAPTELILDPDDSMLWGTGPTGLTSPGPLLKASAGAGYVVYQKAWK